MTRDEFETRYDLLDLVAEGATRTFHALSPSGAVVMVHFVDAAESVSIVRDRLRRLRPRYREEVQSIYEVDGAAVVITRFIKDFLDLDRWILARLDQTERPPDGLAAPPERGTHEPEDPRESIPDEGSPLPAEPVDQPRAAGAKPTPEQDEQSQMGELTALFSAHRDDDPGSPDSSEDGDGEFSSLYRSEAATTPDRGSPPVERAESKKVPTSKADDPPSFSGLFDAPGGSPSLQTPTPGPQSWHPPAPTSGAKEPSPGSGAGGKDWLDAVRRLDAHAPHSEPPAHRVDGSSYEKSPDASEPEPRGRELPAAPSPFTRVMKGVREAPPRSEPLRGDQPRPAAPSAHGLTSARNPPAKVRSSLGLVVGACAVLALAAALIVFVAVAGRG